MEAVKSRPVLGFSVVIFTFWSFGIMDCIHCIYNRIPLKPVLGGVSGVATVITIHEQTQSNRVCYYFCGWRGWGLAKPGLTVPASI